ncbi:MAG TPA: BamA/TamA family outer membrane protein [Ferruginibacter sp.]|jgi:outer membrane protein assembly factor BamA|nr:BamA/TamA family outer membrane protein [Ferruginibacter sp.]
MQKKYSIFNIQYSIIIIVYLLISITASAQYQLRIQYVDKDSAFDRVSLKLQTSFSDRMACTIYINKLRPQLNAKGYAAASIDSVALDSTFATIQLFVGKQQHWVKLNTDNIDKKALSESGFVSKLFIDKQVNISQLQNVEQHILNYYEINGYPFAAVYLDSIHMKESELTASLKVDKGPLYHVDSIRVHGKVNITNSFLQHYLDIPDNGIYNKNKLEQIDKKLSELPFLEEERPATITMLATGSTVNLYLKPKKNNQFNFLIGFAPTNSQTNKLQVTGNVNLNLKNSLGTGESILLSWQQLQIKSPKLDIAYQQPYILKSPFGANVAFELFKKDSTYIQINGQVGLQYLLSATQSGEIFIQKQATILLASGVDTLEVIALKQLPPNIDVSSTDVGWNYNWSNTNYKLNPTTGNDFSLLTTIGLKNISKNSTILNIQDTTFNYASLYDSIKLHTYQFKINVAGDHFFKTGKQATLKIGANVGIYSSPSTFRNELFQIGGNRLLRGFDEESIYATQYLVGTAEYRFIVGQNSYIFSFVDVGWTQSKYQDFDQNDNYIGGGIGMVFETKLGLLNVSYAVGRADNVPFNLSEASKIHFGYVNYF